MHRSTASSQSSSFGFQTPIQPSNPVTQVAQLKPANPAALCKEFSAQSLVSSLAQSSLASSYPSTPEQLFTLLPLPIHLRVSQDKDQGSIPYRVSHCSDQVVRIKVRAWNTPHAFHCKTLGVIVHSSLARIHPKAQRQANYLRYTAGESPSFLLTSILDTAHCLLSLCPPPL